MTTTKSIITPEVPVDLTAVYTNSTAGGAVLKSLNLNGVGDPTAFRETTTDAQEWSYFGSSINPFVTTFAATGTGFGVPMPVQLSDNRVLLLSLPHYQHMGCNNDYMNGTLLHCQIVEYQTNKYAAGPITNVTLPTSDFNGNTYSLWSYPPGKTVAQRGGPLFKAIALSPTLVVAAYRVGTTFRLMRLNISGNVVDNTTVTDLDLTGTNYFNNTTAGDFDLAVVRDDATKVVVAGYTATAWSLQAYNIPTTGSLTSAGSLYNTSITSSLFHVAIGSITRNAVSGVNYFYVAGCTAVASFDAQIYSFTTATNAWSAVGTKVTYARTTAIEGLSIECISTGTTPNAVLATTDTGNTSNIFFFQQNSITQAVAAASQTTLVLQHATAKSITHAFNWGNERAVFVGGNNLLVGFNSAGTAFNFLSATTDTASAVVAQIQWFPFNSRPLYTFYETTAVEYYNVPQYHSRKDVVGTTGFGTRDSTNNYFPYGHDYDSRHYAWNDVANCWIVGQGGRIYALSAAGVVLSETTLYNINPGVYNYLQSVSDLTVTKNGNIVFITEQGNRYAVIQNPWTQWSSLINTMYAATTTAITTAADLPLAGTIGTPTNLAGFLAIKMFPFTDYNGNEVIYFLYHKTIATPATAYARWSSNVWATGGNTSIPTTTAGAWNKGWRSNFRLVMVNPCNSTNTEGRWRAIGLLGTSTQANTTYLGCSLTPYIYASFSSINTSEKVLNNTTVHSGWGIAGSTNKTFSIAVAHDSNIGRHRVLYTNVNSYQADQLTTDLLPSTNNNLKYYKVRTSKNVATIALNSTVTNANETPVAYVYANSYSNTPKYTLTATTGNGQITTDNYDKLSVLVYANGVNKKYAVSGTSERATVTMAISNADNTSTFYITPVKGQVLSSSGFYRSTDTYLIPAGYSIKMKSDTALSVNSLMTVVEEV